MNSPEKTVNDTFENTGTDCVPLRYAFDNFSQEIIGF